MKRNALIIMSYFLVFLAAQRLTREQIAHDTVAAVLSVALIVLFCYLPGSMEMHTSIQVVSPQS